MPDKDYSHRDVVDKLGIEPGQAVAVVEYAWPLDPNLLGRVLDRAGRSAADPGELADVILVTADASSQCVELLARLRPCISANGAIWVLTPKRGLPGYLDQRNTIDAGPRAGLVDNKVCSVSDTVSAIRFVIPVSDRR